MKQTELAGKVINVSTYVSYEYVTPPLILKIENSDKVFLKLSVPENIGF